MQSFIKMLKKIERTFGSMKFAVTIISLFTSFLIYGTFMESYHGADFASRLVYKSWWFMGTQLLMFISIVVATYMRFPLKKRLYGFYTIHLGLITLFIGSFVTYMNGVDGSLELYPNTPARKVAIDKDYLKVTYKTDKSYSKRYALPYVSSPTKLDGNFRNVVELKEFYPSAKLETNWAPTNFREDEIDHGSSYTLFNDNMSQDFTMSLNPVSDFKSSKKLGLLNLSYMPKTLYNCFIKQSDSGFLIWNTVTQVCFTPEEKNYPIIETSKGNQFVAFNYKNEVLKFFPNFSPLPVNDDLTKNENSEFRVFSRKLFEDKPNLFLFGDKVAFYQKRKKSWVGFEFKSKNDLISLPWMGFKLRLVENFDRMIPYQEPIYTRPIQDSGNIVQGGIRAVRVAIRGKDYWVRTDAPLALNNGESEIRLQLVKDEIQLPYQITLRNFKMDVNPGTKDPASYESFVDLLDGRNNTSATDHHVFMNNPLKYDDFTFYQASYFQVGPEAYGSVFSVNFDPGRPIKYAGSILLVLGSIWHYFIRRRKTKLQPTKAIA